ncbi:translation initiation factor IF-2 N-terminal domain-containing protein [Arachnia propionica]|uniref:Ribonuclease E n=1 Tax=Arachnia propionica TaxID=1750 RepID=A0A3P1WSN0_9ACTN|nr:translation initiation factor IF-2 N-terminal domain-containing protein [Arachnia propionica]RRD49629.1 Rne/Rng family ribonuclease [Arachnia propionica]
MTEPTHTDAALPERPRVHQLAKHLGITSKELIGELAALGHQVGSPSSSVPAEAVTLVLAQHAPEPETVGTEEAAVEPPRELPEQEVTPEPAPEAKPRRRRAASRPAGPPVEVAAPAAEVPVTTIAAPAAEVESTPAEEEQSKPAPRQRRRRATRAAGGPKEGQRPVGEPAVEESPAPVAEVKVEAGSEEEKPARGRRRRSGRGRGRSDEVAAEQTAPAEAGERSEEASEVEEDGIAAALRMAEEAARNRRPTMQDPFAVTAEGRTETLAKLADAIADDRDPDEAEPTEESDDAEAEDGDSGEEERPGRRRRRRGGRRRRRGAGRDAEDEATEEGEEPEESGDTTTEENDESEADPEENGEQEEETGTRRRRRRRRRSSESKTSTDDEVTGIEGSTRMEAKRQRRKENRAAGRRRAPILSEAEFLARRESVDRQMVIRQREDYTQLAVLEDGVLVEHYVDRASATSLIGNVYLGRVQNVLPSMEAAFIDIGRGRNAVLYAGEVDWDSFGVTAEDRKVEKVFKSGQTVLVQVTKDPVGAKGARLTGHISLPGRYIVYSPGGHLSGISRKLPDNERARLRQILGELITDEESVIVRTAAEGVSSEELIRDVNRLKAQWEVIEKKVAAGKAPEALYSEPDLTLRIVRDLYTEDFRQLTVQGDDAHEAITAYVSHVAPHLADRVQRFEPGEDGRDIFAQHRIDEQIAKALERKVFLPSGGSLVIDRTEAMTVIDVNTGRFTGSGGNLEATVTSNNLEAAEEIVRQLRLRDLGGIIVIDFIDMVLPSNRELLLRRLVECLGRDRTRHQVAEVTSLGLVQLTRKRIGTGLAEAFTEECTHCHGAGYLKSEDPVDSQAPADGGERKSGGRRRKKG